MSENIASGGLWTNLPYFPYYDSSTAAHSKCANCGYCSCCGRADVQGKESIQNGPGSSGGPVHGDE